MDEIKYRSERAELKENFHTSFQKHHITLVRINKSRFSFIPGKVKSTVNLISFQVLLRVRSVNYLLF